MSAFRYSLAFLFITLSLFSAAGICEEETDVTVRDEKERALWVGYVFRREDQGPRVKDLDIPVTRTPVYLVPHGQIVRPLVNIKVTHPLGEGRTLFVNGVKLNTEQKPGTELQRGSLYVYLNSTISDIRVELKNAESKVVESESIYVFAPEARGLQVTSPFRSLFFKVGTAWLFYGQSSYGTFSANSLSLGLHYQSPERGQTWGLLGDADLTLFTYDSSPEDLNPQFYEAIFGVTKKSQLIKSPLWRSRWVFAANTVGVVAFGSPFGFSGLYGPTVGYKTEYYLNNKSSLGFDFYYTLYSELAITFQDDRTYELEGSFHYRTDTLNQYVFNVSYSNSEFAAGSERIELELLLFSFEFSL
ncbi:MAG: hypothetical protein HRT45_01725 [Bdellovibrionales bacterium]|nr:hypothetical protein [Bdellovibrionales bacterium]